MTINPEARSVQAEKPDAIAGRRYFQNNNPFNWIVQCKGIGFSK